MISAQAQGDIRLPDIPVFCDLHNNVNVKIPGGYTRVYSKDESFYSLKTELNFSYKNNALLLHFVDVSFFGLIVGAAFGAVKYIYAEIPYSQNIDRENWDKTPEQIEQTKHNAFISGLLYGYLAVVALYSICYSGVKQVTGDDVSWKNRGDLPSSRIGFNQVTNATITIFSFDASGHQLNKRTRVVTMEGHQSALPYALEFTLEVKQMMDTHIPTWKTLNERLKDYSASIDLSEAQLAKSNSLVHLGAPQGEYETTKHYKERLRNEELERRTIEAEYQQKVQQIKEEYEIKRMRERREIEKLVNKTHFERTYEYSVSRYNPDRQQFTFTIEALNKSKDLVVPIDEAPQFKTRSGNLVVKQMVKPSLDGRWVPVYDDVVLADASTGKIIPWEGEVPTYATAPVTNPPSLSAAVDLSEPSGEGYLDAEEIGTLKVTLKNDGSGPAKTTRISLSQTSGPTIYYDVTSTVDEIKAGESHTTRFRLTVPESVTDGKVEYSISFLEAQGFEPQPLSFTAETRAQRPPELTLVDFGVVDQSGDGKVTKGESAEITARIQNRGQGKAKGVKVNVIENPVKNIFLAPYSEKEFSLGDIEAGDVRDVVFTVLTNNRVEDVVSVELKMDEKRPRFANSAFVELEIDKQQAQLAPLAFRGKDTAVDIADLATLTVDIEKDIPTSGKKRDNALAVVFGVEDYKNVSSVTFAKRDATYAKEYFEKVLGIPSSRIYFRTDSDVSGTEFSKVFSKEGWLDKRLKKGETEIYIYYAGHGAPELKANKAYLIPYDGDPNYASQTGYALDQLYSELGALGAKSTTVFLDACFSGANRESEVLLAGARPVFMEVDELKVSGNLTVFSAASGRQISSAWPEKKHGLFSYFLMKGMRGDADVNGDREITMGELGDYIKENVSDMAGMLDREQTPGLQTVDRGKVLVKY